MSFFKKPTFNSITAGLQKTISKLESLSARHSKTAIALLAKISEHHITVGELDAEASRSRTTAAKLKELIGE